MDGQVQGQTDLIGMGQDDRPEQVDTDNQATVLLSLEEMIQKYVERIAANKVEIKKHKEMYDDAFINNTTYMENFEKAEAARKDLLVTKKSIASQPSQVQLYLKLKNLREDTRDMQRSLSDYLQEYQRMTGATQLELFDGTVGDIVLTAKVVKRSARV